MTEEKVPL